jgi:hypothetical protein
MIRTKKLPPNPERMIHGLRDTGYQLETAIADVIDNSIAAKATVVKLRFAMDYRGSVRITFADNGEGMDEDGLDNAMTYGSKRRTSAASLGKFGLGLKTASTAFSRKLSVLTRHGKSKEILQATWDLDHVAKTGEWEVIFAEPDKEGVKFLDDVAPAHSGTVVIWDKVDRIFPKEYAEPGGRPAQRALERIKKGLFQHLGAVYQRFLDPTDERANNVTITIDGEKVEPWDPYVIGESTLVAQDIDKEVELDNGKTATFSVRAYVLPRKEDFSSPAAAAKARVSNERQGIYIYREGRLIHDADWLGMFSKEPHFSLLRVEFSFDHKLDEAFHVDIKKSRILLNDALAEWLQDEFLAPARRAAEQMYRKGLKKDVERSVKNAHDSSNANIAAKEADLDDSNVRVINAKTGDVEVTNPEGTVRLKLTVSSAKKPGQCHLEPVPELDDGLLWEPALIEGHKAVSLNTGHPYYHKVYVPNLNSGVTIQGMDSLMWALCAAELRTVNESSKRHFAELRFEVSRLLRLLVADLPEPEVEADDED